MPACIDTTEDGHVHTRLCNHAVGEMEEYVQAAIRRGLKTLNFLEHLETDILYPHRTWLSEDDFAYYFEEGARLRERYQDRIEVRLGAETGFNPAAAQQTRARLGSLPFQRIGLSCHFFWHEGEHLNLLSRRRHSLDRLAAIGPDRIITSYFQTLREGIEELDCDVLCHLDAVLRHLPGVAFNTGHRRQISALLARMRERNVALEINTSGIDYRGTPFPAAWIITEARDLGVRLEAGSDAHQPEEVGRYFDQLPALLDRIGR